MIQQRQYSLIARSYAEALVRAARKSGETARIKAETAALSEAFDRSERLPIFLGNPRTPTEDKLAVIDKTLAARVSPLIVRMLKMMVERERIDFLSDALAAAFELIEQAEGVFPAQVASATELSADDKQRLQAGLEKYTGAKLRISYEVKPELIGGVVFRFRDMLIDSSLRAGLVRLRAKLMGAGLAKA